MKDGKIICIDVHPNDFLKSHYTKRTIFCVYDQIPNMKTLVWKDKEQCLMNLIDHFVVVLYMLNNLEPF